MFVILVIAAIALCLLVAMWLKRIGEQRELVQHSITPDALHALLAANTEVLVFDVRQPLDLLADSEIIPGAIRIPPKEVLRNSSLIPKNKTSRSVLRRAQAMHFLRIKFLKGGLAAWKAKGYPVQPYEKPFQLDIRALSAA